MSCRVSTAEGSASSIAPFRPREMRNTAPTITASTTIASAARHRLTGALYQVGLVSLLDSSMPESSGIDTSLSHSVTPGSLARTASPSPPVPWRRHPLAAPPCLVTGSLGDGVVGRALFGKSLGVFLFFALFSRRGQSRCAGTLEGGVCRLEVPACFGSERVEVWSGRPLRPGRKTRRPRASTTLSIPESSRARELSAPRAAVLTAHALLPMLPADSGSAHALGGVSIGWPPWLPEREAGRTPARTRHGRGPKPRPRSHWRKAGKAVGTRTLSPETCPASS